MKHLHLHLHFETFKNTREALVFSVKIGALNLYDSIFKDPILIEANMPLRSISSNC